MIHFLHKIFFLLLCAYITCALSEDVKNVLVPKGALLTNPKKKGYLPGNFRTFYKNPEFGKNGLPISGSAQPTPTQLEHLVYYLRSLTGNPNLVIYIVDLRQEPHAFLDDQLVQLYDEQEFEGLDPNKVPAFEEESFKALSLQDVMTLYTDIHKNKKQRLADTVLKIKDPAHHLRLEKDLAKTLGVHYVRFPVVDHRAPSPKVLQDFMQFVKTLAPNAWVHFHCSAGRGRTSTFMVLYDLLKRKPSGSLHDVLLLHHKMGSVLLDKIQENYKAPYELARLKVIEDVYNNVRCSK